MKPSDTGNGDSSVRKSGWKELFGNKGSMRRQLLGGGAGSLAVKVASRFLFLAQSIILARILGAEGYGLYAYVFSFISLLSLVSRFGLPSLIIRETAKAQVKARWGLMRGLWNWAGLNVLGLSVLVGASGLALAVVFQDRLTSLQFRTVAWGLLLVLLIPLANIKGASLKGLRKVVLGQLPEMTLRPGLFVIFLLAGILLLPGGLDASQAMALHAVAAAGVLGIATWMLQRATPAQLSLAEREYDLRHWYFSAVPLALMAGVQFINNNIDILVLGMFMDVEEVGVYRVTLQGSAQVAFGLQVVGSVVAPHFARLYAKGDLVNLQRLVTISTRVTLAAALPIAVMLFVFGRELLELFYGPDFSRGYGLMNVLVLGQIINAGIGAVGFLLNMTGHERETAKWISWAAGLNLVLNLCLIPVMGSMGAAVATTTSYATWNFLLWRACRLELSINTMPFGR